MLHHLGDHGAECSSERSSEGSGERANLIRVIALHLLWSNQDVVYLLVEVYAMQQSGPRN